MNAFSLNAGGVFVLLEACVIRPSGTSDFVPSNMSDSNPTRTIDTMNFPLKLAEEYATIGENFQWFIWVYDLTW